jgi:hypothetical protein
MAMGAASTPAARCARRFRMAHAYFRKAERKKAC